METALIILSAGLGFISTQYDYTQSKLDRINSISLSNVTPIKPTYHSCLKVDPLAIQIPPSNGELIGDDYYVNGRYTGFLYHRMQNGRHIGYFRRSGGNTRQYGSIVNQEKDGIIYRVFVPLGPILNI